MGPQTLSTLSSHTNSSSPVVFSRLPARQEDWIWGCSKGPLQPEAMVGEIGTAEKLPLSSPCVSQLAGMHCVATGYVWWAAVGRVRDPPPSREAGTSQ